MPCQGRSRRRRGPTASLYGAWRSAKLGHWDRRLNATQSGNFKPLVFGEIHAAGNRRRPRHWDSSWAGSVSTRGRSRQRVSDPMSRRWLAGSMAPHSPRRPPLLPRQFSKRRRSSEASSDRFCGPWTSRPAWRASKSGSANRIASVNGNDDVSRTVLASIRQCRSSPFAGRRQGSRPASRTASPALTAPAQRTRLGIGSTAWIALRGLNSGWRISTGAQSQGGSGPV